MERDQFNPHDVRSESFAQRYLKSSIYLLRIHVRITCDFYSFYRYGFVWKRRMRLNETRQMRSWFPHDENKRATEQWNALRPNCFIVSLTWREKIDKWTVGSVAYLRIKIWYATVKPYAKTRQIDTGFNVIHRNILVVLRSIAMEYRLTLHNALLLIHAVEFTNDNVKLTIIGRFTYASLLSKLRNYSIASGVIDLWTSLSDNRPIIYIIKL